jgi:hypothetical protein
MSHGFKVTDIISVPGEAVFDVSPPVYDDPSFVIHLLPASVLLDPGCDAIPRHEHIRTEVVSKTAEDMKRDIVLRRRCIFVSHRWVNNFPDSPDNAQLQYIRKALMKFKNPDEMYIWIDYSCMKQDEPDLPTIRRLNYILSHCDFFMLVLPEFDPKGHGYLKRVWCIYEWLACIHFKKALVVESNDIIRDLMSLSLRYLVNIIHPSVFEVLEHVRLQSHSYLHLMTDTLYTYQMGDIFMKDVFISALEALKEDDKVYVYDNISSLFGLVDVLYLLIFGSGHSRPFAFDVSSLDDFSIPTIDPLSHTPYSGSRPPLDASYSSDDETFDRTMRDLARPSLSAAAGGREVLRAIDVYAK